MSETAALLTYERQAQAEGFALVCSWGRSTLPPSFSRPGSISPD